MLRIHNRRHEAAAAKSAWTIEGVVQVEEENFNVGHRQEVRIIWTKWAKPADGLGD